MHWGLAFPTDLTKVELSEALLGAYREANANPLPHQVVDDGPVLENVLIPETIAAHHRRHLDQPADGSRVDVELVGVHRHAAIVS